MVKIVNKALDGNEVATVDRERLKVAKRSLGYGKRIGQKDNRVFLSQDASYVHLYAVMEGG